MKRQVNIIGQSPLVIQLKQLALQVAETDMPVLIVGETGSGKEVLARFIHAHSRRAANSFIPVNCGAIPAGILESELFGHEKGAFTGAVQSRKGYFESADKGSIFLDEIGEMPLETQVKFLRVLESGEFQRVGSSETVYSDARIIAATNRNMYQAVAEKNFREDLFYRLRSVELQIPPLRERGRDILLLAENFVHEFRQKHKIAFEGFSPEATEILMRYPWPGNVRELRNLIESLLVLEKGKLISPEILEKHLVQRNRYKSLVHDPAKSEKHELHVIYSSILQLRQEVGEIRQMLQHLIHNPYQPQYQPQLLLPGSPEIFIPVAGEQEHPSPEAHPEKRVEGQIEQEGLQSLDEMEKKVIAQALESCGGSRRKAARALGITERTLYRKIKSYGLKDPGPAGNG
ncbi:MAG: sigma-54-dependent Fis family transcriptional regulator [Chlorobiaceae bacterium]|nr:sigma-54-dependent Fis family transcriptional regulator [Chlorobiaceae bacterium]